MKTALRLAVVVLVAVLVAPSTGHAASCPRLAVPAYFGAGVWDGMLAEADAISSVVLNPANGPGTATDPGLASAVQKARDAGVDVFGYVDTARGGRDVGLVRSEVRAYVDRYGVDGIYLDRASPHADDLPYYESLAGELRGRGLRIVHGTGGTPARAYADLADAIVAFEGPLDAYRGYEAPSWMHTHPAQRFWHLVYGAAGSGAVDEALAIAGRTNGGGLYVTDDAPPNPWDRLPSSWGAEAEAIRSCGTEPDPTPQPQGPFAFLGSLFGFGPTFGFGSGTGGFGFGSGFGGFGFGSFPLFGFGF